MGYIVLRGMYISISSKLEMVRFNFRILKEARPGSALINLAARKTSLP